MQPLNQYKLIRSWLDAFRFHIWVFRKSVAAEDNGSGTQDVSIKKRIIKVKYNVQDLDLERTIAIFYRKIRIFH